MLLMLPLGILFGLSSGTAALQGEIEGSLSAVAAAPVPVADLVQALQVEMMLVKKTQLKQQGENTGLKSELTELRKENTGLKSELIELRQESEEMKTKLQLVEKESEEMKTKLQLVEKENTGLKSELTELRKVVSSSMDPQLKLVNALEVRSIEDDVQQNTADIADLKVFGAGLEEGVNTLDQRFDSWVAALNNLYGTIHNLEGQVTSIDGRLSTTEVREAVCGYQATLGFSSSATLTFERVYDEVDSSSGGGLQTDGVFKAGVTGIYLITLETKVELGGGGGLVGELNLSSGNYTGEQFINSYNADGGYIGDQASASRYVRMAAGETLHITLWSGDYVYVYYTTMCISLYSASG